MTEKFRTPFQKFIQLESLSGILLLGATIIALVWANSPWSDSYAHLWNFNVGLETDSFSLTKPLVLWINDGFMAIFFFLIGLEIKREILIGELNSFKKIAFPLAGAIGGMTIPVVAFILLNQDTETFKGWGIPMATDIAFSLAILSALGSRVPLSLKIFLTAFAIVDDLGAVLVIALFYSGALNYGLLLIAVIMLAGLYVLSFKGIYSKYVLLVMGAFIWLLFLKSGIHPTLAGVLLAFAVPLRQSIKTPAFVENLTSITQKLQTVPIKQDPVLTKEQMQQMDDLDDWIDRFQSPLQHLEHNLHNFVAYLIIPVFALANAGVAMTSEVPIDTALVRNIIICLVVGNSIGITTIVLFAKKLGIIEVPRDIGKAHIVGVSFLAGIGFTMAIFIAGLAFADNPIFIASAKIGILIGSFISAILGYTILRWAPPQK